MSTIPCDDSSATPATPSCVLLGEGPAPSDGYRPAPLRERPMSVLEKRVWNRFLASCWFRLTRPTRNARRQLEKRKA